MGGDQGLTAHGPGDQDPGIEGRAHRKAAPIGLESPRLHLAAVGSGEQNLDRAVVDPNSSQHPRQRHPRDLSGAGRPQVPGGSAWMGIHSRTTIPGTFHGHRRRHVGHRLQIR